MQEGADAGDVFVALSVVTALFVVLQYPMGALADRVGRRPQLLVWSAATALLIVPLSTLIGPGRATCSSCSASGWASTR